MSASTPWIWLRIASFSAAVVAAVSGKSTAIFAGRFSTTIRSPISSASLIEWVMKTAVLPFSP